MTDREAWAETAAVIESDVRIALDGQPLTPANVKRAAIDSISTLLPPPPSAIVERDATDPNRINVLMPAEWFTAVSAILRKDKP